MALPRNNLTSNEKLNQEIHSATGEYLCFCVWMQYIYVFVLFFVHFL